MEMSPEGTGPLPCWFRAEERLYWGGVGKSAPVHTFTPGLQGRAVRPGTLCLPSTVPTSALAAVLTSGMEFSVYRDPAAQVCGLGNLGCLDSLYYRSRGRVRKTSDYWS